MATSVVGTGFSVAGSGGGGGGSTEALQIKFIGVAGENLALGDVVRFDRAGTPGELLKAQATTADPADVVGVVKASASSGGAVTIYMIGEAPVLMDAAPAAASNGARVYLSPTTPGVGTITVPTGAGEAVVLLGWLVGADGSDTSPAVVFNPALIALL